MHIYLAVFDLVLLEQEKPCENENHVIKFSYYQSQDTEWYSFQLDNLISLRGS